MASKVLFSYTVADIGRLPNGTMVQELTGDAGKLIRYFSKAAVIMTSVPDVDLNLDTCIIRNGSETVYGTYAEFENVESNEFILSAEDDEGNVYLKKVTPDMVDYTKLTCNVIDSRPDTTGSITLVCYGDYFNGSFGAQSNTLTVNYRYKLSSSNSWSASKSMTITKYSDSYVASATLTGLNYQNSYDFEFIAADSLMSVSSTASNVKSVPVFHWGENDVTFEVPVNFNKGANGLEIPDPPEYGFWTPAIPIANYYTERLGWYYKVGQIVTVGFCIKADCQSGFDTVGLYLYTLPFTPITRAAGGGMCSGAYISANHNFQCFVVEPNDSTITTRTQACDSTSGSNLTTSASGCRFPSGGGELTLSGTITYITS